MTVPKNVLADLRLMRKKEALLMQRLGRTPTLEEVAAEVRCLTVRLLDASTGWRGWGALRGSHV